MNGRNKRTLRILITGTNSTFDNGDAAMSSMAIKSLKNVFPSAKFIIGSTYRDGDSERYRHMLPSESNDITIISAINSLKIPQTIRAIFVILRYVPEFLSADLCIDISGDGYSDVAQHSIASSLTHSIQLFIALSLRKKIVICAQSIGPFRNIFTRSFAKYVINRVNLVTVREEISKNYLRSLGITKPPVEVTGDLAFLLDPIPSEQAMQLLVNENVLVGNRILVGIAVSEIISNWAFPDISDPRIKYNLYIDLMGKLADFLVETLNCVVILIPQSVGPFARHDDRIAMGNIYKRVRYRNSVAMINGQYTPQEIRGIIGQCRLLVSGKMHSAIAAVSMFVPVVILAYSFKTPGIFGRKLGIAEAIIDVRTTPSKEFLQKLLARVGIVWDSRDDISRKLRIVIPQEKANAFLNAKLIEGLVESMEI